MRVLYAKSFASDIDTIKGPSEIKKRLLKKIDYLKQAESLDQLHGIRKIVGYANYYRIRIGDYRLGLKCEGNTIELIRFLHRRVIYRKFP